MLGIRILVVSLMAYASAACIVVPPDGWTLGSMDSLSVASADSAADSLIDSTADAPLDTTDYVDLANLRSARTIERRLRHVLRRHEGGLERIVRNGTTKRGDVSLAEADSLVGHLLVVRGDADIRGKVLGNLITLDGDVILHQGSVVSGQILVLNGKLRDQGGEIGGDVRAYGTPMAGNTDKTVTVVRTKSMPWAGTWWPWMSDHPRGEKRSATAFQRTAFGLAGTLGALLTLLGLGIGLVTFARSRCEIVSNTVTRSFGRSFLVGLVSQILLMPTFGVLVVGLIVSVVGILLLPFAVVTYFLLVLAGVAGGYVAVALAMGAAYAQRRPGAESFSSTDGYRPLMLGLGALAALWIAWALLHWVPIAGALIWAAAFLVTWLAATAGFGAMLLSRAGTRTKFAGPEAVPVPYQSPGAEWVGE